MIYSKISLLIPTYGKGEYLASTIKSILNNHYPCFEIIICTQGESFLKQDIFVDDNIKEIHIAKPSRYLSRIELFKHAVGDYIWFVDDDDEITPNSLYVINDAIQRMHPDCLIFNKIDVYNELNANKQTSNISTNVEFRTTNYKKEDALKDLLCTNDYNSVCTKIFKKRTEPCWINVDLHQSEDKLLNYAFYKTCNSFIKVDFAIYKYFLLHGNWGEIYTPERLNDSIEARKILIKCEPKYSYNLFVDILERIKNYLISTCASSNDKQISFNVDDYNQKDAKRALISLKFLEYKSIYKKKYSLLRFKGKILRRLSKNKKFIKDQINESTKQKKKWLHLLFPLACFSLISPIALLFSSGKIQDVANDITSQTRRDGFNLISFYVNGSATGTRPSFSNEYYTLHDQFNTYSRCIETYDPLKLKGLKIDSFCDAFNGEYKKIQTSQSNDLSFLTSPGIQVETTFEEKNGIKSEVYRNFIYKFQFNYKGLDKGEVRISNYSIFCALHEKQANELLEIINSKSDKKIDKESLLGMYIGVSSFDGKERFVFRIFNIIKDNADYIADYDAALGNFIFVNDNTFGQLELHNSYMMTTNSYENYYNLKTRINIYKKDNFRIAYGNDINKSSEFENIQKKLDEIMDIKFSEPTLGIVFVLLDFFSLVLCCFVFYGKRREKNYFDICIAMCVPSIPFLIIKLVGFITKSIFVFSYITSLIYFLFVMFYEVFLLNRFLKLEYENKRLW